MTEATRTVAAAMKRVDGVRHGESASRAHASADAVRIGRGRRALNVVASLAIILITAPIWILVALLIKVTSRGPVFYHQVRVGLDKRRTGAQPNDPRRRDDIGGRPFTIYKFRTMHVDAEDGLGAVWASKDDPRVTWIGRWLRQYRIDELPQLINVLRGEMNLVGPRPERPSIVADLRREIPHYQDRHRTLPGITGHAQINLQYDSSLEDVKKKVEHDLDYLRRASAWEDFKIMVKTIPVMLFRRGSR